jgi:iron complex outermembrane receptor protein
MLQTSAATIRRARNRPAVPLRGAILCAGLALTPLASAFDNSSDTIQVAANADATPRTRATQLPTVKVNANGDPVGYAMKPDYAVKRVDLGPLGQADLLRTPYSISVVPADLLVNSLAMDPTELLRYLPSTQLEYRSGAALGRPQSRGFEGEMVSNSRIDGLNAVDSTSYGIEQFDNITVLNGLAGALYGPQVPGGIFEYNDKRPTDDFLNRLSLGFGSDSIATEAGDFGGRLGNDGWFGYRVNLVHGEGSGPYTDSHLDRNLASGAFDIHFSDQTVLQLDTSTYHFDQRGYPGIFIYNSGGNTVLPSARSSTQTGYGQPYGGMDLDTKTHLAKLTHDFNDDWHVTIGALHQVADRYLPVISNNFTNNSGAYTATLGQNSISRFTINSNLAYLTGKFDTGSLENDVSFGTNGYDEQRAYGHTPTSVTLGSSNYYASSFLPEKPWSANPGFGNPPLQTRNQQQSLIAGDTLHFNAQWAVMGVISDSYLSTRNFSRTGQQTSDYQVHDAFSPTVSLIYTPSDTDTFYLTYASSEQPGDTAPENALNANDTLSPYRSKQYEFGYKTQIDGITLGSALFSMQRAYALVDADDVYRVAGEQRNNGLEVSAAGNLTSNLTIYGGFTWLDATLEHTHNPATDDKRVVGVPRLQSSLLLDYNLPTLPRAVNAWAFSIGLHQTGNRAATTTNTSYAAGYATVDLGTRMSFSVDKHPLIIRLALNNATNTHYWASVYPGSVNGGSASDTAALGVPRTWQASVELDL